MGMLIGAMVGEYDAKIPLRRSQTASSQIILLGVVEVVFIAAIVLHRYPAA